MALKKATKPRETGRVNNVFTWDRFVKDCARSKYVLVIGNEAILNKSMNITSKGDSQKWLFDATRDYLSREEKVNTESEDFTQLSKIIRDLRQSVLNTLGEFDFGEDQRNEKEFMEFYDANIKNDIEPELLRLLGTRCFRVILTTTIDPYLECTMRYIWGAKGFRVLNIYGENKDFLPYELEFDEFNEIKPTLYYVFGKADLYNQINKFVLSENDAMSVIPKWFSAERPKELLKYIQGEGMKILSIGCKFDNWLFRFFWFILRGDVSNLSNGQVAVEFSKEDEKLKRYLEHENVKLFPDARQFMGEAYFNLDSALRLENLPRKQEGIFISYAHEDKYIARPLFDRLREEGFPVWIDEKGLEPSDEYDKRIRTAINSCRVFMPLLSSQVRDDLENGIDRYYWRKEWNWAQIRYEDERQIDTHHSKKMKVLPVIIGDYQVRDKVHEKTLPCIKEATAHEISKSSFCELVKTINKIING